MILLDTSIIVDFLRGEEGAVEYVNSLEARLGVCYPVACELYKGVYRSSAPEKGEERIDSLLENLEIVEPGKKSAKIFGQLRESNPEASEFDLMIASISEAQGAKLATRDEDFSRIDIEKEIV